MYRSLALLLVVGCATVEDTAVVESETGNEPPCGSSTCNNSPAIPYGGFHELNLLGLANGQGLSILTSTAAKGGRAQLYKAGTDPWDLHVEDGRFLGRRDTQTLEHQDLVGAFFVVLHAGKPAFLIHIAQVRQTVHGFGPPAPLELYKLIWQEWGGGLWFDQPVCNAVTYPGKKYLYESLLGMLPGEMLIFEGDRIDEPALEMSRGVELDWVNFGCAGGALSKLALTGAIYGRQPDHATTKGWSARQARLKLLAADYCGTGTPFTIPGEPLLWRGSPFIDHFFDTPIGIEARWNEHGATCLTTPRLHVWPDTTGTFPADIWPLLQQACPQGQVPPPCAPDDPALLEGQPQISANRGPFL